MLTPTGLSLIAIACSFVALALGIRREVQHWLWKRHARARRRQEWH